MTAPRRSMTGRAGSLSFLSRLPLPRDRRPLLQRQNGGSRTETRGSALGCGRHCSPGAPIAWPSSTTLLQRRCAASVDFLPALTTRCHETARAHYDPKRPDRRGQRPTSSCCCCGSRLPLPPIWSALWFGLKASAAPATGPALPTTKYPPPPAPLTFPPPTSPFPTEPTQPAAPTTPFAAPTPWSTRCFQCGGGQWLHQQGPFAFVPAF